MDEGIPLSARTGDGPGRNPRHGRSDHGAPCNGTDWHRHGVFLFHGLVPSHGQRHDRHGRTDHRHSAGRRRAVHHPFQRRYRVYYRKNYGPYPQQARRGIQHCRAGFPGQPLHGQQYDRHHHGWPHRQGNKRQIPYLTQTQRQHSGHLFLPGSGSHPLRRSNAHGRRNLPGFSPAGHEIPVLSPDSGHLLHPCHCAGTGRDGKTGKR